MKRAHPFSLQFLSRLTRCAGVPAILSLIMLVFSCGCGTRPDNPGAVQPAPPITVEKQDVFDFLRDRATKGSETERRHALMVLIESRDKRALNILADVLPTENDRFLRRRILKGFIDIGDPVVLPAVRRSLKDRDDVVQVIAAYAMVKLGRLVSPDIEREGYLQLIKRLKETDDPEPSDRALNYLRELSGRRHPLQDADGHLSKKDAFVSVKSRRAWRHWLKTR